MVAVKNVKAVILLGGPQKGELGSMTLGDLRVGCQQHKIHITH